MASIMPYFWSSVTCPRASSSSSRMSASHMHMAHMPHVPHMTQQASRANAPSLAYTIAY